MSFQVSEWDNNDLGDRTHSDLFKKTKVKPSQQMKKSKMKNKTKNEVTTKSNDFEISNPKQKVKKIALEKNERRINLEETQIKTVSGTQEIKSKLAKNPKMLNESQIKVLMNKKRSDKKKLRKLNIKKLQREQNNTSQETENKVENIENTTEVANKRNKKKKLQKLENVKNEVMLNESIIESTLHVSKLEKKLRKINSDQNMQEAEKDKKLEKELKRLQNEILKNIQNEESSSDVKVNKIRKENEKIPQESKKKLQGQKSEKKHIENKHNEINDETIRDTPQQESKNKLKKKLKRLQNNPNEESSSDVKVNQIRKENGKIPQESKKKSQGQKSEKKHIENNHNKIKDETIDTPQKSKNKLKKKLKRLQNTNLQNIQNDKTTSETNNLIPDEQSKQNNIKTQDNKEPEKNQNKKLMNIMKLKEQLDTNRIKENSSIQSINPLRERMLNKLRAARFRFINEQIYTNESKEAQKLFQEDPGAFKAYHDGYRQQISKWPLNPLDTIINAVKKMPNNYEIADFGCGDARLAKSVPQKVYSFDLVSNDPNVVACDMAHCPLKKNKVDVVVFCLSLMGTNLKDYLFEANRVLKVGGILKIAEVESRFEGVEQFIEGLIRFGFTNTWKDLSHNLFYFLNFKKERNIINKKKLPTISLNPCLYKKR